MNLDERTITEAQTSELPRLVAELARLHALALARIVSPTQIAETPSEPDELLTPQQVADALSIGLDKVHRLTALRNQAKRPLRRSGLRNWVRASS